MAFLSGLATTFTGHVSNCVRYDEYTRVQKERSFTLRICNKIYTIEHT